MWKLLKWIVIILLIGGVIYYLMDYNAEDPSENDIIESTKEFSKDVLNKTKKEGSELIEKASKAIDSSKQLKGMREELKN